MEHYYHHPPAPHHRETPVWIGVEKARGVGGGALPALDETWPDTIASRARAISFNQSDDNGVIVMLLLWEMCCCCWWWVVGCGCWIVVNFFIHLVSELAAHICDDLFQFSLGGGGGGREQCFVCFFFYRTRCSGADCWFLGVRFGWWEEG